MVELKTLIQETKDHLVQLKSRQATAEVSRDVSKQLSDLGGVDNTKALLQRMEEKTQHLENEATAYSELDKANRTTSDEINDVLNKAATKAPAVALEELKRKRAEAQKQA